MFRNIFFLLVLMMSTSLYAQQRTVEGELMAVEGAMRQDCTTQARVADAVIGTVIGTAIGALASRGRRDVTVGGGLAGGGLAYGSNAARCQQLAYYRQQLLSQLASQLPQENYSCRQVLVNGRWVIDQNNCQREVHRQRTLGGMPYWAPQ